MDWLIDLVYYEGNLPKTCIALLGLFVVLYLFFTGVSVLKGAVTSVGNVR